MSLCLCTYITISRYIFKYNCILYFEGCETSCVQDSIQALAKDHSKQGLRTICGSRD